jgi:hypothetical protein
VLGRKRAQVCRRCANWAVYDNAGLIYDPAAAVTRVARYLLAQYTKKKKKYTELSHSLPNGHKIFQMDVQ